MRCEEVVDYMQRNLDGDLAPDELSQMEEHLCTCEECQTIYANLLNLHLQLEGLPDVEPPSSIVDSILPVLQEETAPAVLPNLPSRKKQWRSWTFLAGGAAAAIILILLAVPQLTKEPELQMAGLDQRADQESAEPMIEERAQENMQDQLARKTEENMEPSADTQALSVPEQPRENEVTSSAKGKDPGSEMDSTALRSTKQPSVEQKPTVQESVQKEEEMSSLAITQPESAPDSTRASKEMGLMASTPEEKAEQPGRDLFHSPTGAWNARIEGQQVVIADAQGQEVFRSHEWKGTVYVSVEWANEVTLLYTLFPVNGAEAGGEARQPEKWTINVKEGQEQKQ